MAGRKARGEGGRDSRPAHAKAPDPLGVGQEGEPWGQPEPDRKDFFDEIYRSEAEPWTYSERGAEILRHEAVASLARTLAPDGRAILDIGCSLGQLTARLAGAAPTVYGMDLSPTAVRRARSWCDRAQAPEGGSTEFRFAVGGCTHLPFAEGSLSLALLCDGLHSWRLSPDDQQRTLREVERVLRPGAYVILTDHLKPRDFGAFVEMVRGGPLEVVEVRYLHNRLWFSLSRALQRRQHRPLVRGLLRSREVARALQAVARLAGRRGAKHILVVARRRAEGGSG